MGKFQNMQNPFTKEAPLLDYMRPLSRSFLQKKMDLIVSSSFLLIFLISFFLFFLFALLSWKLGGGDELCVRGKQLALQRPFCNTLPQYHVPIFLPFPSFLISFSQSYQHCLMFPFSKRDNCLHFPPSLIKLEYYCMSIKQAAAFVQEAADAFSLTNTIKENKNIALCVCVWCACSSCTFLLQLCV